MNIAIIGCGYVADFYMATLPNHPNLRLIGAFDRNVERKDAFARHHKVRIYETLEALLADPQVELILNLTNPGYGYTSIPSVTFSGGGGSGAAGAEDHRAGQD